MTHVFTDFMGTSGGQLLHHSLGLFPLSNQNILEIPFDILELHIIFQKSFFGHIKICIVGLHDAMTIMNSGNDHQWVAVKPWPSTPFMWWTSATGLYTGEHVARPRGRSCVCGQAAMLPPTQLEYHTRHQSLCSSSLITLAGYTTQT